MTRNGEEMGNIRTCKYLNSVVRKVRSSGDELYERDKEVRRFQVQRKQEPVMQ